ncbi:MAG: hypothetical protein OXI30_20785 [Chloroflexota bacterium]|nr:hypothetical protein [Chloroflexota bacterium]
MIAPELVTELQRLNREEKLAVLRLLQDDLVDESSEWDKLVSEPGRVFKNIGPIRASAKTIMRFEALSKELNTDG